MIFLFAVGLLLLTNCSKSDDPIEVIEAIGFTGELQSCGDFFVSKLLSSAKSNIVLTITGSGREELNLDSNVQEIILPNANLSIEISEWDASLTGYFCTDILTSQPKKTISWKAVSGTAKINIIYLEQPEFDAYYTINIALENVVFESNFNGQIFIEQLTIENATVGWFAG